MTETTDDSGIRIGRCCCRWKDSTAIWKVVAANLSVLSEDMCRVGSFMVKLPRLWCRLMVGRTSCFCWRDEEGPYRFSVLVGGGR